MSTNQIFISYSHKDKFWLDKLQVGLQPYLNVGENIKAWDDSEIRVGGDWEQQIMMAMQSAKVAVLLVSPDFLASKFIKEQELPFLFEAAKNEKVTIVSVAVRDASWETIQRLEKMQWANDPQSPLALLKAAKRDAALKKICQTIYSFFPKPAVPANGPPLGTIPPEPKLEEAVEVVEAVSQSAGEGLKALLGLMSNSDVKAKVATFEADFANASEQIELLGYYKDLHDVLHELQFACYNYLMGIVRGAKRDPDDLSIWDNVVDYEMYLREKVVRRLHKVGERNPPVHGRQDWIPRLLQDLDTLFATLEKYDAVKVEAAIKPIQRVLALKPVSINASLTSAAEALRLSKLVSALAAVHQCLDVAKLNPERVQKFTDGVAALGDLEESLNGLKDSHNEWHEIDSILRLADGSIATDYSDLESFWPELKQKTEDQCKGFEEEEWAMLLRKEIEKLEKALTEADGRWIRQHFQTFKTRAGYRFYNVDLALKELCERLSKVGKPLTEVWEMIK